MHLLVWIKENWKTAVELLAIAAVAFAVMIGANTYWKQRSLSAAEGLYSAHQMKTGSDEQVSKLEEIASGYPRTPAGWQAMMMLGNIYLEKNNYEKATEEFRVLTGRSRHHPILNIAALHKLAETEIASGNLTAAADTYLKAAADPHNLIGTMSRYHAAECLEKAGDINQAVKLYHQVMSDSKDEDRAVRNSSEERLIWLLVNHLI